MSDIHPTAIIDSGAELAENVKIGPFCIVEAGVSIGAGTELESSVRLKSGTRLGQNNQVGHGCCLGGLPQSIAFDPATPTGLVIGDNNIIRELCNFNRASKEGQNTTIGNDNYFMGQSHIGHDCILGNHIIYVQGSVTGGHVEIDDYAFVGGETAIHQFVRVGTYAMVAGVAKVVQDVPPYATVDGNPATVIGMNVVGLKRAGFDPDTRKKIKQTYKTLYHSKLNTGRALQQLRDENDSSAEVQRIRQFFEESSRGVCSHR